MNTSIAWVGHRGQNDYTVIENYFIQFLLIEY